MKNQKKIYGLLLAFCLIVTMFPVTVFAGNNSNAPIFYSGDNDEYRIFQYSDPLYVRESGDTDARVAYCYNSYKARPGYLVKGQTAKKHSNATGVQFLSFADRAKIQDADKLQNAILSVCYKGYPYNGTGIKEKYGLNDAALRGLTQLAVWYYSDSLDMNTVLLGQSLYQNYSVFKDYENALDAYQELITPMSNLPLNYKLDLYETDDKDYQHALATRLTKQDVGMTGNFTLTGKKVLEGKTLMEASFRFEVKDKSSGEVVAEGQNRADGTIEFSPIAYTGKHVGRHLYTISEVKGNAEDIQYDTTVYEATVVVSKENGKLITEVSYQKEGKPYTGDIVFINKVKTDDGGQRAGIVESGKTSASSAGTGIQQTETGDRSHPWLWASLVLLAAAGIVTSLFISKRAKKS